MALPDNITPTIVNAIYVGDDGTPGEGTVSFTPSKGTYVDDTDHAIILPVPVVGTLGTTGELLHPDGTTGVKLVPSDATGITPTGWTYDVAEAVTVTTDDGESFTFKRTYAITVPSGDPIDLSDIAPTAAAGPGADKVVLSVNGKTPSSTGAVTLAAADVHALPDTYVPPAAPVTSVNGKTGVVVLSAGDVGALPSDATFVESVNGKSGTSVTLSAGDVGAMPNLPPVTLTDAATIETDASLASHFRVTLAGNRTLENPTNLSDGQKVLWELIQDGTGGRTITLGSRFAVGADIGTVSLSTDPAARDFLGAVYNSTENLLFVLALERGF